MGGKVEKRNTRYLVAFRHFIESLYPLITSIVNGDAGNDGGVNVIGFHNSLMSLISVFVALCKGGVFA